MHQKKLFLTWACMGMLYASGQAQTAHWNADGSVTVSGGTKTFTTYIAPTDETVRSLMTHLNLYRIYYGGGKGQSGINASGMGAQGNVTFQVFAYDRGNRKKGNLLYGCYSTSNGTHEQTWLEKHVYRYYIDSLPSNDMKKLAQRLLIYRPQGYAIEADWGSVAITWSWSRELHPLRNMFHVFASGKNLAGIMDTTAALLTNTIWPRSGYLDAAFTECLPYFTPIQPVIAELSVTNATVHHMILPEMNVSNHTITPYDLFHVWQNTDYSQLFQGNRPSVVAHRGYWRNAGVAQNSLGAIQAAANSSNVDIIELDVRSSQDKKGICFHDDKPQKVLQDIQDDYPNSSVYDLPLATLLPYKLYDRFDLETSETLLTLEEAFKYLRDHNITKPVNLDIGIPDTVPSANGKISGKPYFNAVFLEAVGAACRYGLTDRIIFKGKYTYNDPIWSSVSDTLHKYNLLTGQSGMTANPIIAYTPKLGDDTNDSLNYRNNWLDLNKGRGIPFVAIVGMEIRLKNDDTTTINTFLKESIPLVKSIMYQGSTPLRVGIFSETPTSCSGYWTKSAVEKYVDFKKDLRNNFDWVLNHGYDYIITDIPEVLTAIMGN